MVLREEVERELIEFLSSLYIDKDTMHDLTHIERTRVKR